MTSTKRKALTALFLALCMSPSIAQQYTYETEGFEDAKWGASGSIINAPTGRWTTNKNIRSAEQVYDGAYSLKISQKAGLMSPELAEGAGALVYYVHDTNRQVYVDVSTDGNSWANVEAYKVTAGWTKHIVPINRADVRYVKIYTTSNNQLYIDNISISRPDGTLADGTELMPEVDVTYFRQDFEDSASCPTSKDACSSETSIDVAGQGQWLYLNAYKDTNTTYIVDGSSRSLRMLKGGSYVVTPVLDQGVARVKFNEARKGRDISVYVQKGDDSGWTLIKNVDTETDNEITIYDRDITRLKLINDGSSDANIDNIEVSGFPEGTKPTVTTGEALQIASSKAVVTGSITDPGDKPMLEYGMCWSTGHLPHYTDNVVKALTDDFTVTLTGLPCDSEITCRAYAISMAGIAYGDPKTFTTLSAEAPKITVVSYAKDETWDDEQHVFLTVSAKIDDDGGSIPTEVGVCFSTAGSPTVADSKVTTYLYEDAFVSTVMLQPSTKYHLRAYAINAGGTGYSDVFEYTTPAITVAEYAHNVYYVKADGDDSTADGSISAPYYSLQKAVDNAVAGDTIYMMNGTYHYTARINMPNIGKPNSGMISIVAKDGRAVLDFSAMPLGDNNQGIRITGSYWYIYGLDICGAGDNGMLIERNKPSDGDYNSIKDNTGEGHDNVIENCRFYRNQDTGLQMKNLAENNRVINCDSYFNTDPDHGDADGYAVKISHGTGNYFYGCRAWNNSDDGWDGFIKTDGNFPDDVTTTLEHCWAFNNGYLEDGSQSSGNGNGFKLGSAYGDNNMVLNRCLAFENLNKGFDQNHNTGDMILANCTGYATNTGNKNKYSYRIEEPVSTGHEVVLINCVAVGDGVADYTKSAYARYGLAADAKITTCEMEARADNFVSTDPTGMDMERDADGHLPVLGFMHITPGNTLLIDTGTPVVPYRDQSRWAEGIVYNGTAPDLGCFETEGETGITRPEIRGGETLKVSATCTYGGSMIVTIESEHSSEGRTLVVYDEEGAMVMSHTFYGNTTIIDTRHLPHFYILSVYADGKRSTIKVINNKH